MAITQAQLDNLYQELVATEQSLRIGDKSMTRRSVDEIRKAIAIAEAQLNSTSRVKAVKITTASGY